MKSIRPCQELVGGFEEELVEMLRRDHQKDFS